MGKSGLITYSKAVAILGVIIYHLCLGYLAVPSIVKTASGFGGAGVHIFIFCSGFGLMVSYIRKPLNFIDFIKRRFVKKSSRKVFHKLSRRVLSCSLRASVLIWSQRFFWRPLYIRESSTHPCHHPPNQLKKRGHYFSLN